MRTARLRFTICTLIAALVAPSTLIGQWASDDGIAIGDRTSQQSVAKIHATADGGCYISWFDNGNGGYDVYLQRLDAAGNEMWPHNGILVADRSFSWTQDYGLDVDTAGNAIMAFRDDIVDTVRVCAARISPDGTLLWGPEGVVLTGPADEVMSPRIAATTDGGCVVGWTGYMGASTAVKLQKLDADGEPQWNPALMLTDADDGSFMLSDLRTTDDGSVIASWVRQGSEYWDPRHLWAQKISSAGTLLWDPGHVVVFDGGTLQYGNFPTFVSDGSGGAVFSCYFIVGAVLDCAAQRILADGTEQFAHNGALGSTLASQYRVSPSVSFNPATSETFLFWNETNTGQSRDGVYGQKFDVDGNRQWGDSGRVLVAIGDYDVRNVSHVLCADGATVFWFQAPAFDQDIIRAARVDGSGDFVWSPSILNVTPTSSGKSRLAVTSAPGEGALLAWMDNRNGDDDIYAQNMFADGTMGHCLADLDFDGDVDLADLAQLLANYGVTSGAAFEDGDLDDDGDVDLTDLAALLAVYGGTCH